MEHSFSYLHPRKLRISLGSFLRMLLLLVAIVTTLNFVVCLNDVLNGKLVYSKTLGWINRTHAITTGTTSYLNTYKEKDFKLGDTIIYAQSMGLPFFTKKISLDVKNEYLVIESIAEKDKPKALFYIFKDVSEHFEAFQCKIPFFFMRTPFSSGFSDGDLMGNLISYYCADKQIDATSFVNSVINYDELTEFKNFFSIRNNYNNIWIPKDRLHEIAIYFYERSDFAHHKYLRELNHSVQFQCSNQH